MKGPGAATVDVGESCFRRVRRVVPRLGLDLPVLNRKGQILYPRRVGSSPSGTECGKAFQALCTRIGSLMVEPQSSLHAGRSKILEPDEKVDGRQYTLEDLMAKIEANPSNQRLLKQFGVRESVKRVSERLLRLHCTHGGRQ